MGLCKAQSSSSATEVYLVISYIETRGHEMFHDDMIMYVIINDQQSFMATINISSA